MMGICHYCNRDKANVSYIDVLLKNREKTVLICLECRESELSWWDYFKSDNILERQWNLNRVETVVRNYNKVKEYVRVAENIVGMMIQTKVNENMFDPYALLIPKRALHLWILNMYSSLLIRNFVNSVYSPHMYNPYLNGIGFCPQLVQFL